MEWGELAPRVHWSVVSPKSGGFFREMWMRLVFSLVLAGSVLTAAPLAAQGRTRPADSVPAAHKPPAGMCRIWLPNVPAGKQAAPTDCATAVRNRPANAKVIFGEPAVPRRVKGRDSAPAPLPLVPSTTGKGRKGPPPIPPPVPPPGRSWF